MSAIASVLTPDAPASIVAFPDARRAALVARVAAGMDIAAADPVALDLYCDGVSEELFGRLAALGLDEAAQDEAVGAFFIAVEARRMEPTDELACSCCGNMHG